MDDAIGEADYKKFIGTYYYDVKSSKAEDYMFLMTRNEMAFAKQHNEYYGILFVTNAQTPKDAKIMKLRNPLSDEAKDDFERETIQFRFTPII